ncbi:30S ribosomal protein S1 [Candidatus Poribacteria bacterium]|nr:30S ribosomal protein S1 [Candidatus Poribacteria bacterium]
MDKSSKNEQTTEEPMDEAQQAHSNESETEESQTIEESVAPGEDNGESSLPTEPVEEDQPNEEKSPDEGDTPQQESAETKQVTEQTAAVTDEESSATDLDTESMTDMDALYSDSLKAFDEGEIVVGHIVNVTSDEVMVDIGFKSEGYVPIHEFKTDEKGNSNLNVGDQVEVYIVRHEDADGQLVLSKQYAEEQKLWDSLANAEQSGEVVEGKITERIKGGMRVEVGALKAFLPASQIELHPIRNWDDYINQTYPMKIVKLDKRKRNIVVSRRSLLEEELSTRKAELLSNIKEGELIKGTVKNITEFGAFIDLNGIDGLLHKSDMSWRKIHNPSEVVSIDEEIEAFVINVDLESERISLGLKQKTTDPWESVFDKYPIGSTVKGQVVNIVSYGVFIELEEGVEGLIHISEISWTQRNVAPSKIVMKDQELEARVIDIDTEKKRISLSYKQLVPNPWELLDVKYPFGTKVTGTVKNVTNFGAFIEIEEGIDGLVHSSDFSWLKRNVNPRSILSEGQEVEAVVQKIDPQEQRISLSIKHVEPNPWNLVSTKYAVGSIASGEIVNLTEFGAFARLEEGIEGLIHISELSEERINKPDDVVSKGDVLDLKVIELKMDEQRIGLSLKQAVADREREVVEQYEPKPKQAVTKPKREIKKPNVEEAEETTSFGAALRNVLDFRSEEE